MGTKSNAAKQITLSSLNGLLLDPAAYTAINEDGLSDPCYMIRILNHTHAAFKIYIGWGGQDVTKIQLEHDYVPMGDSLCVYALPSLGDKAAFGVGTIFYVSGSPSAGTIMLMGYYQPR